MAVSVPTEFNLLRGRDSQIERAKPIRTVSLDDLALNSHYAYAYGSRRMAVQLWEVNITGITTPTTICEVAFRFAFDREDSGLRVAYAISHADVDIYVRDSTDSSTLASSVGAIANTGAAQGNLTITGLTPANAFVIIRIQADTFLSDGAAGTVSLGIWEKEHTAGTLP